MCTSKPTTTNPPQNNNSLRSTEHAPHSQANNSPNCTATYASKSIPQSAYQSQYYSSSLFSFAMSSWDASFLVLLSFWGRRTIVLLLGAMVLLMRLRCWGSCRQGSERGLQRGRVVVRWVGRIGLFGGEGRKSLCLWCVKLATWWGWGLLNGFGRRLDVEALAAEQLRYWWFVAVFVFVWCKREK